MSELWLKEDKEKEFEWNKDVLEKKWGAYDRVVKEFSAYKNDNKDWVSELGK